MASSIRGIPLSKISPAFLHSNSTSHTWAFSAFAELIDNAYDPDVSASELLIDKVDIRKVACLIFLDNGAGMDKDKLHKMLSFGFCEKDIYEKNSSHQPIGHYGNGFKSGSMRIGMDALVFTRCEQSASIGFLSQSYLKDIKAESVFVPILEYRLPKLERYKSQESRNNLNAILNYSVFKFEEELKAELRALEGSKTGTKIIISNLKRLQDGKLELDFSSDPTDIRCPEAHEADMTSVYHRPIEQYISEYKLSLREYCSILFLRPRMKITIRGHRVKSKLISKSLSNSETDFYKPSWLMTPIKIIFGFTCEKEKTEDYGLMLYHRNRLIKAFERVGYQKQPDQRGIGVVGVAQVDFLQPIHNKQDFKWDGKFNSVMKAFATKLNDYWNEKMNTEDVQISQTIGKLPDWNWVQCDQCLKWRRLPDSVDPSSLPGKWYCRLNTDGTHNRCDIAEEPEDEDLAVKPRFEKTFKKRQEERKRLQRQQQIEEEMKKKRDMEQKLKEREEELRAMQRMKQEFDAGFEGCMHHPTMDRRARKLEQALAEAQKCIEEQARLMEQMTSGTFPSSPSLSNGTPSPLRPDLTSKRKATVESLPTKGDKKLCIKTETGELLAITRNFGDDEDAAEPGSSHGTSKKTPFNKSKPPPKSGPLRVAMPFHPPKSGQHAENKKDNNSQETKDKAGPSKAAEATVATAADPTVSKEKSVSKKGGKSKSSAGELVVVDLTGDGEEVNRVTIKPDPDALPASSSVSNQADVKPDKASLDARVSGALATGKDTGAQDETPSSREQPMEISQTVESNLETAMAAIKERVDQERLTITGSAQESGTSLEAATTNSVRGAGSDPTGATSDTAQAAGTRAESPSAAAAPDTPGKSTRDSSEQSTRDAATLSVQASVAGKESDKSFTSGAGKKSDKSSSSAARKESDKSSKSVASPPLCSSSPSLNSSVLNDTSAVESRTSNSEENSECRAQSGDNTNLINGQQEKSGDSTNPQASPGQIARDSLDRGTNELNKDATHNNNEDASGKDEGTLVFSDSLEKVGDSSFVSDSDAGSILPNESRHVKEKNALSPVDDSEGSCDSERILDLENGDSVVDKGKSPHLSNGEAGVVKDTMDEVVQKGSSLSDNNKVRKIRGDSPQDNALLDINRDVIEDNESHSNARSRTKSLIVAAESDTNQKESSSEADDSGGPAHDVNDNEGYKTTLSHPSSASSDNLNKERITCLSSVASASAEDRCQPSPPSPSSAPDGQTSRGSRPIHSSLGDSEPTQDPGELCMSGALPEEAADGTLESMDCGEANSKTDRLPLPTEKTASSEKATHSSLVQTDLDSAALERISNEAETLRAQLKESRCSLEKLNKEKNTLHTQLSESKSSLDNMRRERDTLGTQLHEREASLDKMRGDVYRLLERLVPEVELGNVDSIEQVVEDMIKLHDQGLQSQTDSQGESQDPQQ